MRKYVRSCPTCEGKLEAREFWCPECDIAVKGRFDRCEFCDLPEEQLTFLRLFVSRRGNLREVERELGLSYPTVRARLDDLLRALKYPVDLLPAVDRQERRREILGNLKAGDISPEQAIRSLRGEKGE
ncbi:MAG: DUF2089 family protein [Armatimonadetes bacterium]|nr:DUF2089 family protein [Armatimonadota bacterium]NIM23154.1 DUF2089 family protein [Armatimonadota bacterium]NIM67022.1 DUF2089 family protein [Armatimonadota bacterium]NIM75556.1 DUF2089 family protein [Armatimonadota bacterium]NIN05211.1 DUF2089 family protein [Armatimonadota bacterium]